jgi:hypothetical protein
MKSAGSYVEFALEKPKGHLLAGSIGIHFGAFRLNSAYLSA